MRDGIIPIGKKNLKLLFPLLLPQWCALEISSLYRDKFPRTRTVTYASATLSKRLRWALGSIRRILALDGAHLGDIIKVTVYIEDARNFGRYNRVFAEHFPGGRVSRPAVEAPAVIECKIGMDAVAYRPSLELILQ